MSFSRPGAIDLSALAKPSAPPAGPSGPGGGYTVDVSEQTFQTVALEASMQHVVVLALWSPRAPQSRDFVDLLGRVVDTLEGRILLAAVDIDDSKLDLATRLGATLTVNARNEGQPVPLFQGLAEEAEVRQYLEQLVALAVQNGLTGRATPAGGESAEPEEPADDPRFAAADAAFAAGDTDTAVAEYERLALQHPGDAEVAERLAGVKLFARTKDADLQQARKAAADAPDDVDAQLLVADLDVSGGHVEDAFARLVGLVRTAHGEDRDRIRERLLELFTVVGTTDPRVADARRALASALF